MEKRLKKIHSSPQRTSEESHRCENNLPSGADPAPSMWNSLSGFRSITRRCTALHNRVKLGLANLVEFRASCRQHVETKAKWSELSIRLKISGSGLWFKFAFVFGKGFHRSKVITINRTSCWQTVESDRLASTIDSLVEIVFNGNAETGQRYRSIELLQTLSSGSDLRNWRSRSVSRYLIGPKEFVVGKWNPTENQSNNFHCVFTIKFTLCVYCVMLAWENR